MIPIHRLWITFGGSVFFLALAGLQLWSGRTFIGFGWRPSPLAHRKNRGKEDASLFWWNVWACTAGGLFLLAFTAFKLIENLIGNSN